MSNSSNEFKKLSERSGSTSPCSFNLDIKVMSVEDFRKNKTLTCHAAPTMK
jgi:hypothetical protein